MEVIELYPPARDVPLPQSGGLERSFFAAQCSLGYTRGRERNEAEEVGGGIGKWGVIIKRGVVWVSRLGAGLLESLHNPPPHNPGALRQVS